VKAKDREEKWHRRFVVSRLLANGTVRVARVHHMKMQDTVVVVVQVLDET
jgi:hypothetical protein